MTAAAVRGDRSRRPFPTTRSWSSMRCCLLLLLLPQLSNQQHYLKKLFADAGVAIHCPSDNKVYIHPISGDLQQCSQQLGNYNESSCPEGTVCERFPILIPGFQDYCCWADGQNIDNENKIIGSTTEIPEELMPFTEPPIVQPMRKLVVTAAPERPDDEDDRDNRNGNSNEDNDYEEPTTKRPRNRKTTTTTTTEEPTTTTKKPSNRRLPRCPNPDDMPLIDFGNRLRDCYYHQCIRGYRCEFNTDIRRFICCGSAPVVVQPIGMPVIPNPKPLIPRPNNRRGPFNFNDGDEEESDCPYDSQNGCKMKGTQPPIPSTNNYNSNQNSNNWNENNCPYGSKTSTGCPYGPSNRPNKRPPSDGNNGNHDGCSGYNMQGCTMRGNWNQNSNNIEQQQLPAPNHIPEPQPLANAVHRPQESRGFGKDNWNEYDNNYESGTNRGSQSQGSWNNNGYENGKSQGRSQGSDWKSGKAEEGNWNNDNWEKSTNGPSNSRWSPSPQGNSDNWDNQNSGWNSQSQGSNWNNLPTQPPSQPNRGSIWNVSPAPSQNVNWNGNSNQNQKNWEQNGGWSSNGNNGDSQNWGNNQATMIPKQMGNKNDIGKDYDDYGDNFPQKSWGNEASSTGQPKPFNWNNGPVGSNKRSKPNSLDRNTCPSGSEFRQQDHAPKCIPPGSDSCPLSHPRCMSSPSLGHNVCCL